MITSVGTVQHSTNKSIKAITRQLDSYVVWPDHRERNLIQKSIKSLYSLPKCIGFVEGCCINFEHAPTCPSKTAGSFHSCKECYGLNIVCVVDNKKLIWFLHWGYSASSGNQRVQRAMLIHTNPQDFFNNGQYILADSGFTCTKNIIPMFKRVRGQSSYIWTSCRSKF